MFNNFRTEGGLICLDLNVSSFNLLIMYCVTRMVKLSKKGLVRGANYLYYSVREPFPSNVEPLQITSFMAENEVIFSDGIECDFLEFNSRMQATIKLAEQKGLLVV